MKFDLKKVQNVVIIICVAIVAGCQKYMEQRKDEQLEKLEERVAELESKGES